MNKQYEYLKYDYTDQEIADAARDLAKANRKRTSLEQRKKEVDAAIKAEIEAENSIIARLSNLIGTGFEFRDIEVRIELDTPEAGKKRTIRLDTGEEVSVKAMTDTDKQMVLDLQSKAEAQEAEAQKQKDDELAKAATANGVIVTPPPTVLQIGDGSGIVDGSLTSIEEATRPAFESLTNGPTLALARTQGGTHQKGTRGRKPRNPEAESFADGSDAGDYTPDPEIDA